MSVDMPAFPVVVEGGDHSRLCSELHYGMSLGDWFAGMAMTSVILGYAHWGTDDEAKKYRADQAAACYAYADAMLAERAKQP